MARCPHCKRDTIGYFAKFESWRGGPIKCSECGGLSFFPGPNALLRVIRSVAFAAFVPVLVLSTIVTRSLWAPVGVAIALVALIISYEVALSRKPLVPSSAGAADESRKWSRNFAAVLLAGSAVTVIVVVVKYAL